MNSTHKSPEVTSHPVAKKNSPVLLLVGALGIGLLGYVVGHRSAPTDKASENAPIAATQPGSESKSTDNESEGGDKEGASGTIQFTEETARLAGLEVRPASLKQLATAIPFNGQIAPNPDGVVRVASLVPGRVTRLSVAQGDRVQQGQVLAIVESRAIGEAQSAYQQAVSRFQNAQSNLNVVLKQARAGVFSRAPLEAARRTQVDAIADVQTQQTAVRQAQTAYDNALRLARVGSFASPALETARAQSASANEALKSALAALNNARASVESSQSELNRRRQLAASGAYISRPVQEAQRALVSARSARAAAQSEVATTRLNLNRARSLVAEGLVSQRDVETAQQAGEAANARLDTAQADETAAQQELERQQRLASTSVADTAEIQAAQSALTSAQSDVRTRNAEATRAREGVRLTDIALSRERAIFRSNIANRREISTAQTTLDNSKTALVKARQILSVANETYNRERRILGQNLNNIAQVQAARSAFNAARAELEAAQTALKLFKSSPGGSASVPVRAPISGIVQTRDIAQGETIEADKQLLTLVNLDTVAVEAAIYEKDFALVRIGVPVTAAVDAFPGRRFTGRITFLGSQLDPETRTLTARASLDNKGQLRPGMFARGQISTSTGNLAVTVPSEAVQTLEEKTVVFVMTGKAHEFSTREVTTGATTNGQTEIKRGLKPGEKVVAKGAFVVKSQAMKSELAEE